MPHTSFAELGVPRQFVTRLEKAAIVTPTPIQGAVIADVLAGRDVCGRAPTGSGKTLAFGLPLLAGLPKANRRRPTGLVLAPTRELAQQIATALQPFAADRGRSVTAIYGGVGYGAQRAALDRGVDLVVACPGRLEDLLAMGALRLDDVRDVVIDEADRMADMGFVPAVRRLVAQTHAERHLHLFSATFDGPVGKLSAALQRDPVRHEVGDASPDMTKVRHVFWQVERQDRPAQTADVIRALGSTMVFCRTRHGADRLAKQLTRAGVAAAAIHGGRSQGQRDRALSAFVAGQVAALVATDVAARGVHVDDVAAVVHYDPPADAATYVHRSGRTARAGASGIVVSMLTTDDRADARTMLRKIGLDASAVAPSLADLQDPSPQANRRAAARQPSRRRQRPRRVAV